MTRHQRFDVRVSPNVEGQIRRMARRDRIRARELISAQDRLAREGTRATGAKKLKSLDLWEIRAGDGRLFFCLVPGTPQLAVGATTVKTVRRLPMTQLKRIERTCHRWRQTLEVDR